ncbi:hypothetical protein BFINE_09820 [Bacteroides finegoldii DSM 17565]|nr:hypothetical protein BFINE_09820 [Bacteroides finegoldii DSM 17565]
MSSYFTFAITLTVAYIIYYAVNIVRDLYGKKGDGKTEEETFDLGPVDTTEESIDVSENETGFSVGVRNTTRIPRLQPHRRRVTATRKRKKPPRRGSSG